MGEHSKPEPQYESFDRPLRSNTPRMNLAEQDVDFIVNGYGVEAMVTMKNRELYPDDDPEILAANQLEWELNLLAKEDPEHAAKVAGGFFSHGLDGEEYPSKIGANIAVRLVDENYELASELIAEVLKHEHPAKYLNEALVEGVASGLITPNGAARLVGDLAKGLHEASEKVGRLESEDRRLAREAAKRGITLSNVSHVVVGDGVSQTVHNYGSKHR